MLFERVQGEARAVSILLPLIQIKEVGANLPNMFRNGSSGQMRSSALYENWRRRSVAFS